MKFIDYYKIMGLDENASDEAIKKRYRKLARKFHPDVSNESDSEEKFKQLGEAYAVLKDPERRREYDELKRYGGQQGGQWQGQDFTPPPGWQTHAGFDPSDFHGGEQFEFSDFFEQLFGGRSYHRASPHAEQQFSARGQDQHARLGITLQNAYDGSTIPLTLKMPAWHSDGSVRSEEKSLRVKIPKGVTDGQKIRLRGQGGPGFEGAPAGDLFIEIAIQDDKLFHHDGRDITVNVPIAPWEAALGGKVTVPTLAGPVSLTIPENAKSGQKLRLKGRGLPGNPAGDQYVVLSINVPEATTGEQKALYKKMQQLWAPDKKYQRGA